jgi:hypothetical protein
MSYLFSDLLAVPEHEIYQLVSAYAKIYPAMTKLFQFNEPSKVRIAGFEERNLHTHSRRKSSDDPMLWYDSLRRTKTRLSDLVISNNFDLFCTFTFAEDRQNINLLKYKMERWLKNQNRLVGKFAYLVIPEFHPKALAEGRKEIHFHALFKHYNGALMDSGHRRKDGRVVYNLPQYSLGFTTATRINVDGVPLVASYIKKYITKDMPQFNNKKRYWCSHDLVRPEKVRNPLVFPYQMQKFTEEHQMKTLKLRIAYEKMGFISSDVKGVEYKHDLQETDARRCNGLVHCT